MEGECIRIFVGNDSVNPELNGRADDLIYFCFCEKYQNNWINYIGSKL